MNKNRLPAALRGAGLAVVCGLWTGGARVSAQSLVPAVWVSNNGNLEGSVTAFRINPDGTLAFVNRVVTGSRSNLNDPCAGCNAYEISLSPDGRHLATGHPAGDLDGITVFSVNSDASVTQKVQVSLPVGLGTPLDVAWLDNEYLAATRTDTSPDQIAVYRYNPLVPSLVQVGTVSAISNSLGYLAKHPCGPYLYANDSSASHLVHVYAVGDGGSLTFVESEPAGATFPLEINLSPNLKWLYSAGGISNGGNKIVGMDVLGDGTLTGMAGSPFVSPGSSPSNVYVKDDNRLLYVGHGSDATVRTFSLDSAGVPTSTGNSFDVGLQGTLGDVRGLAHWMFVTDNSTAIDGIMGLYSFTVSGDGSLTQNGPITVTGGIAPRSLATWMPPIKGDLNCDNVLDYGDVDPFCLILLDLPSYTAAFPCCDPMRADMTGDLVANADDIQLFVDGLTP